MMDKVKLVALIAAAISFINLVVSQWLGTQLFADADIAMIANGISLVIIAGYTIYAKFSEKAAVEAMKAAQAAKELEEAARIKAQHELSLTKTRLEKALNGQRN